MNISKSMTLGAAMMLALSGFAHAAEASSRPLESMKRFIGTWSGTTTGQAGNGTVTRSYRFVMDGKYIQETNTSTFPARESNTRGEVHEHMSMFSFDKARKAIILRQFHIEGFVNTYRQSSDSPFVFESESFENFSNSWQARESYEFTSDDEFIEVFELAPPGKPFKTYSRNHFKRVSN